MTNARVSRKQHAEVERLTAERNALLDVLNGVLLKAGGMIVVEHEHYLGHVRHPVETIEMPEGILIRLNDSVGLVEAGKALIVVPTAKV